MELIPQQIKLIKALSGRIVVNIAVNGRSYWLHYEDVLGPGQGRLDWALADLDFDLKWASEESMIRMKREVARMTWESGRVLDSVGWTGPHFALPSGRVFSPTEVADVELVFPDLKKRCQTSGTLEEWQREVAEPISNHTLLRFVVMGMLAPPIMAFSKYTGNPAFEIIGNDAMNLPVVLQTAASVIGRPWAGEGDAYWMQFEDLQKALDQVLTEHADLPIICSDTHAHFIGVAKNKKLTQLKPLAHEMADGRASRRDGLPAGRFVLLVCGLRPLGDLAGDVEALDAWAGRRVMTLRVPDRPSGVFNSVADVNASTFSFAQALSTAASRHYGTPMEAFIAKLVQEAADDREGLRAKIDSSMKLFRKKARVDLNDPAACAFANAFGLVYAAGALGKSYGVLPASWRCGSAVMAWYRKARGAKPTPEAFARRLWKIVDEHDHAWIGAKQPKLTADQAAQYMVFRKRLKSREELIIRERDIANVIPDWPRIQSSPEVQNALHKDGNKMLNERTLVSGGQAELVYCFILDESVLDQMGAVHTLEASEEHTTPDSTGTPSLFDDLAAEGDDEAGDGGGGAGEPGPAPGVEPPAATAKNEPSRTPKRMAANAKTKRGVAALFLSKLQIGDEVLVRLSGQQERYEGAVIGIDETGQRAMIKWTDEPDTSCWVSFNEITRLDRMLPLRKRQS